jgi:hypothetical protein
VRLRANCDANGIGSKVDVRAVCLGASTGTVAFSINADTMNIIVADDDKRPSIQVPLRRLDAEIREPPTLIKIDAEGADDDVLAGAGALLDGQQPLALLIETIGGGGFGRDAGESAKRLAQLGFVRCRYDPRARVLEPTAGTPINNYLFIRDVVFARGRIKAAPRFDLSGFGSV